MSRKRKWKPELPDGFLPLYNRILNSEIFNYLSCYSQIIYIKAMQKAMFAKKYNNGFFTLIPSDFKQMSKRTFRRHIKSLLEKKLIVKEEQGGLYRNANKYSLTPIRNIFLDNRSKPWGIDTW